VNSDGGFRRRCPWLSARPERPVGAFRSGISASQYGNAYCDEAIPAGRASPRTAIGLPLWAELMAGVGWKQSSYARWRASLRVPEFVKAEGERMSQPSSLIGSGWR
jgi:hypothetical protein